MTVALRPSDFAGGDVALDGGVGWEIGGRLFTKNPRRLLDQHDRALIDVWRRASPFLAARRMGGAAPLPDRGGVSDQAAVMVEAIDVMDSEAARLLPPPGAPPDGEDDARR